MISVQPQPEPYNFDENVKKLGKAFLKKRASDSDWKGGEYWTKSLPDLAEVYGRICAYSCLYLTRAVSGASVDHFVPKSVAPDLAYEWNNYRLAASRLNSRKLDFQDVLDPFTVGKDWFVLVFPGLLIKPNDSLPDEISQMIETTINRLKLNDTLLQEARLEYVLLYCDGLVKFEYLKQRAPFIAYEIERQNLQAEIFNIYKQRTVNT